MYIYIPTWQYRIYKTMCEKTSNYLPNTIGRTSVTYRCFKKHALCQEQGRVTIYSFLSPATFILIVWRLELKSNDLGIFHFNTIVTYMHFTVSFIFYSFGLGAILSIMFSYLNYELW